ncbi:MAG: FkbM family methyltransferase, partial [Nanoarchaeota archaeon]
PCDIVQDNLAWVEPYPIIVTNAVIDIMQYPLEILAKILQHVSKYIIIHRQEITEHGQTHVTMNGSYGGFTYHSIINRKDFVDLLDKNNFDVIKEIHLDFGNWENGGSSFLIRKRRSYSLDNIDLNLYKKYLVGRNNGFFVEAGANDGIRQNNTLFFEFYKNWNGILIEPIPEVCEECRKNRSPNTIVENYALVADSYKKDTIKLIYPMNCHGMMSVVKSNMSEEHKIKIKLENKKNINVNAITLNALLEKHKNRFSKIDLMVIDVEGYELEVLQGIDFNKYQVDYLLIEERENNDNIKEYLFVLYERIEKMTEQDWLYRRK